MTEARRGLNEREARVQRAQRLAELRPASREILEFYRKVAGFQEHLYLRIGQTKNPRLTAGSLESRGDLDLTELLGAFPSFLALVQAHAPRNLAEGARQLFGLGPDSWIAMLKAYWQSAGRHDQQLGAFPQFFARAFLQPYAEFLAYGAAVPARVGTHHTCPICGSRPLLGVLRPEGDGAKRFLLCAFCSREWEFRRIYCATCGEYDETKLPVYVAEQLPYVRVEACDTCKSYLRTIDLSRDGNAVPVVDDLASLPLTLWAHEHGYSRPLPNLLGT